ncbi:MAG: PhnD/SsuA/transferrin family substrate-binding protein [Oscillospiraceae bacterium]|jgi:NitT/TauT family transport system substrate-binding protein|nr:PhnD/SsuA/transferrin family substrate-binding protein [Oscillospiraceae bacterium]
MRKYHRVLRILCAALALGLLAGVCLQAGLATPAEPKVKVRLGALKGPTALGALQLAATKGDVYDLQLAGAPDEMVAALASGQVDIAALPTNLAPTLYNKTQGGVRLLALNTLGVLYVLQRGDTVQSVADLAGKTLLATGQGATPEYTINYILAQAGLTDKVTVAYKAEHAELATLLAAGQTDLALLPEPFVTTVRTQDPDIRVALDVTEAFEQAAKQDEEAPGAVLSMGCWVVRAAFAAQNPQAVADFLRDYAESAAFVNADPAQAAKWAVALGVLPSEQVAAQAIPGCHIVSVSGAEMKAQIAPLLQIWYRANPASIGGALPGDDFYYAAP